MRPPLPALRNGDPDLPFAHLTEGDETLRPYCQQMVRRLRLAWEHSRGILHAQQLKDKERFDATHKLTKPLKEGERVLLFEPNLLKTTNKLTKGLAWTGPYRVEKVLPHNNVKLRDLRDNRAHDVVHMDRLRLWKGSKALVRPR